ncbi:hypothetical protein LC55x_1888 [Lysobacter capsici]|nr:hypothetical protein LC55x_1888 [Lysobacter capsici]
MIGADNFVRLSRGFVGPIRASSQTHRWRIHAGCRLRHIRRDAA